MSGSMGGPAWEGQSMINRPGCYCPLANRPQLPTRHGRQPRRPLGVAAERPPDAVGALDPDAGIPPLRRGPVHRRSERLEAAVETGKHLPVDAYGPAMTIVRVIGNLID